MVQKGVIFLPSAGIDNMTNWAASVPAESPNAPKPPVCPAKRKERERPQRGWSSMAKLNDRKASITPLHHTFPLLKKV